MGGREWMATMAGGNNGELSGLEVVARATERRKELDFEPKETEVEGRLK